MAGALEEEVTVSAGDEASARSLARDGLVNLGYAPLEAEELLEALESDDPEELIAAALRRAGESKSRAA